MVESLLRLAGLDWRVPDFSTVCRRQKTLQVQLPYRTRGHSTHICSGCLSAAAVV
jgi:hypothetical protein